MSDTTDLRKAITYLYIAAGKSVADDVKTHAEAVIGEVKYLRDEQSKSAAAYGYAIKEIERLKEELDKYREAAEIFRDFGRFHHLHTAYDTRQVAKARAILEESRDER